MSLPPPPTSFNMADYVLTAGRASPDKIALKLVGGENDYALNYSELEGAVLGVARGLKDAGAKVGDRVLLRLTNSPLFPICYLGAIAAGMVAVPTSNLLTPHEVEKLSDRIKPRLILASADLAPISRQTLSDIDINGWIDGPAGQYHFGPPDRPAYIVFTSGTSAEPRAVEHAHRAVWARRLMFDDWYGLRKTDRVLHAGAFNWTYTMGTGLIDPWTMGASSLIPVAGLDASLLAQMLADHSATLFAAAPGVYRKMLKSPVPLLPTLRHGLSAGEKLPEVTHDSWLRATGTPIYEAYGMSECSTFISSSPKRPAPADTLGFIQFGRQVKLRQDGMIMVHRHEPGLMRGYVDDQEAMAEKFDGDWFLTGDFGAQTDEGAIQYLGREDDLMNAGGLRVSPVEVEAALQNCAPMHDWACAEVRLKEDVSIIAAFYAGTDLLEVEDVKLALASQLAAYKQPRLYVHVPELPKGANNKLLRRELRTKWEAENGQTRHHL